MKTRNPFPRYLLPVLLLASATVGLRAQTGTPSFTNVTVHDPSIVRDGATFYVFGSHLASARTTDLMNWTQISTTAAAGNALVPNPAVEFQEALAWAQTTTFWAPDVIKLADGRYYFYYNACKGDSPLSAMGIAVADAITGPYKNQGLILKSGGSTPGYNANVHPNVVDPSVFFDQAGKLWMVYGSYSGGIFILELNPANGTPLAGQSWGKKLIGGNHARIEGAYILYSPESAYYYLFVSFGGLGAAEGYNMRMGRSRNPDGPFVDAAGTDLATVAGAPGTFFDDASIAPHGVKLMGGYQFQQVAGEPQPTSRGYVSPGHNSAYYDPTTGKYFLVFHTRFVGRGDQHEVRVHQMFMNADGWLVAAPHRYAGETLAAVNPSQVRGQYKLINHGKSIAAGAVSSVVVTLNADRSVTGAVTGTWELTGSNLLTVTVGGVVHRGVAMRQWDDDQRTWVIGFSALSNTGVSIWGSKVAIPTAPVIEVQPAPKTAAAGQSVTFSVQANAVPEATYQWRKDGANIAGATGDSLTLTDVQPVSAGTYSVVVTNSAGAATSAGAALTLESTAAPTITVQPRGQTIAVGSMVVFDVTASGTAPTYQWRKGGTPIAGATSRLLVIAQAQAADAGDYSVTLTNSAGTVTSTSATLAVVSTSDSGRIVNVSVRTTTGTGDDVLIVGFVTGGPGTSGAQQLLIRGLGPRLADFGVPDILADPIIQVIPQKATTVLTPSENDNWSGDAAVTTAAAAVGATPLTNTASKDSALLSSVPSGGYSVKVLGANGTRGTTLAEVYDAAPSVGGTTAPRLINISARAQMSNDNPIIAGFVVVGSTAKTVLIRGIGPYLSQYFGAAAMSDPTLKVYVQQSGGSVLVTSNDDWAGSAQVGAAALSVGAFALTDTASKDAVLLLTLAPGVYSAQVNGANNASGIALLEVYVVP